MKAEFPIALSYIANSRNDAIFACIAVSLSIIFIPAVLFIDQWNYMIPLSFVMSTLWIKFRWHNHIKEICYIKQHKLILNQNTLTAQYSSHKLVLNLSNLVSINVNHNRDKIKSIKLLLKDQSTLLICGYKKMEALEKELVKFIEKRYVKYNRWFHVL